MILRGPLCLLPKDSVWGVRGLRVGVVRRCLPGKERTVGCSEKRGYRTEGDLRRRVYVCLGQVHRVETGSNVGVWIVTQVVLISQRTSVVEVGGVSDTLPFYLSLYKR